MTAEAIRADTVTAAQSLVRHYLNGEDAPIGTEYTGESLRDAHALLAAWYQSTIDQRDAS